MRPMMQNRNVMILVTLLFVAGCAAQPVDSLNATGQVGNVPDRVIELADPDQNVATARLNPSDGCYWYEHSGPVENILVPLRTVNGNPICTQRES